jgi:TatD DNase family protein
MLVDTHCHIHESEFFTPEAAEAALEGAVTAGVPHIVCVGTSLKGSQEAINFSKKHRGNCRASVGIHPHEAVKLGEKNIPVQLERLKKLAELTEVVAIGECGLDFYYNDRKQSLNLQRQLLRGQLTIAQSRQLPVSFHVREAFDDFWPVLDEFKDITGVLHSFTDRQGHLDEALRRGLFIGVNGIATFTSHSWQKELYKKIPLEKIVVETDAPFLTPVPKRGTINLPENVIYITKFLADLRGEDVTTITRQTTINARQLFGF